MLKACDAFHADNNHPSIITPPANAENSFLHIDNH